MVSSATVICSGLCFGCSQTPSITQFYLKELLSSRSQFDLRFGLSASIALWTKFINLDVDMGGGDLAWLTTIDLPHNPILNIKTNMALLSVSILYPWTDKMKFKLKEGPRIQLAEQGAQQCNLGFIAHPIALPWIGRKSTIPSSLLKTKERQSNPITLTHGRWTLKVTFPRIFLQGEKTAVPNWFSTAKKTDVADAEWAAASIWPLLWPWHAAPISHCCVQTGRVKHKC